MNTKNILVINGHPDKESFNRLISEKYQEAALAAGAHVRSLSIGELTFNPNLQFGYRKRTELEPDLLQALDDIHWSNHIVWVHPLWWYSFPAIMKGFIDRLFLPGIAFANASDGSYQKLFVGRSSRIITTADTSPEDYDKQFKNTALVQLKTGTLEFTGIEPVFSTYFSPVYYATETQKETWLGEVAQLAQEDLQFLQ